MFKNYLKITLRNILKYKAYSLINVLGLAVGMAGSILILLYVSDELSYDKQHEKAYRIYRVTREFFNSDGSSNLHLGHVALPIAPQNFNSISVKIKPDRPEDIAVTLDFLKQKWQQIRPDFPFQYSFLDDRYEQLYRNEHRLGQIFGVFSLLAVFIACLGLFGLASYMAEQRIKEIGIRKVLGASVSIVLQLSKDFTRLVIVAMLLAWPVAWYAMNRWLEDFAYRINIHWWVFAVAGGLALLIALLTVSTQAIKAALVNPVESLRYE